VGDLGNEEQRKQSDRLLWMAGALVLLVVAFAALLVAIRST
jgi:predicted nucleic acid-binding Zn ribbon protein